MCARCAHALGPALGLLLLATAAFAVIAKGGTLQSDGHERVVGEGQIRFDGAGPEKWAYRFRRERRLVSRLRVQLAGRLPRLVYLVSAFGCIHDHEGSWTAATGNGYFGGLQMDKPFMHTYAPDLVRAKGTADNWTVPEQLATAIVAYADRGFQPWPNTARICGLR